MKLVPETSLKELKQTREIWIEELNRVTKYFNNLTFSDLRYREHRTLPVDIHILRTNIAALTRQIARQQ